MTEIVVSPKPESLTSVARWAEKEEPRNLSGPRWFDETARRSRATYATCVSSWLKFLKMPPCLIKKNMR